MVCQEGCSCITTTRGGVTLPYFRSKMTSKNSNTNSEVEKVVAPHVQKTAKELAKEKLDEFIREETRLVKGRFRCIETPGSSQRIQVRKYPGVPMFDKTMVDGEMYEVPLYIARHLNGIDITAKAINGFVGSCSYPVHGFKWNPGADLPPSSIGFGPNGEGGIAVPIVGVAKRVRRFGFESLEFDIGGMVA